MTSQTGVGEIQIEVPSSSNPGRPPPPNLPESTLIYGPQAEYFRIGVPLYDASIKGDWKAAKVILDQRPNLVRFSLTENCETALHVAASSRSNNQVVNFVKNLVTLMDNEDMALENKNHNTALYLAASVGNLEIVKIMVEKHRHLMTIRGGRGEMMPLYVAALFGKYEVVKYLFKNSNGLTDSGWTFENRGWLVEKCVEADMFDVALEIVKRYPELGSGYILGILARKPKAFLETKSNIIWRIVKPGKRFYLYDYCP